MCVLSTNVAILVIGRTSELEDKRCRYFSFPSPHSELNADYMKQPGG